MKQELLFKTLHPPRWKVDSSFFSPSHAVTEIQADDERFSKRDSLMTGN